MTPELQPCPGREIPSVLAWGGGSAGGSWKGQKFRLMVEMKLLSVTTSELTPLNGL